jgi:hypothetical protein
MSDELEREQYWLRRVFRWLVTVLLIAFVIFVILAFTLMSEKP